MVTGSEERAASIATPVEHDHVLIVGAPHPSAIRQPDRSPRHVAITDLIARVDKHVTISDGRATLKSSIEEASLHPDELAHVNHLIESFNSAAVQKFISDFKIRMPTKAVTPSDMSTESQGQALGGGEPPPAPCVPHVTISFFWWGFRLHLDHCFCDILKFAGAGTAAISFIYAMLVASGVVQAGNPYIQLAIAIMATMLGWILWADGACTPNAGANYNNSWAMQGWVTTVC